MECSPKRQTYAKRTHTCYSTDTLKEVSETIEVPRKRREPLRNWAARMAEKAKEPWRFHKTLRSIVEGDLKFVCPYIKDISEDIPNNWKRCTTVGAWLHQNDIESVLKQLVAYKARRFAFVRPSHSMQPSLSIEEERRKERRHDNTVRKAKWFFDERKTRIGFLFNATDATGSTKPEGSHWTAALFIKSTYKLFYFDSFGGEATERIAKVLNMWRKAIMEALNKETEPELIVNKVKFQNDMNECGVWCIHFLDKGMNLSRFKEVTSFRAALHQLGIKPIYTETERQQLRLKYFSTVPIDNEEAYNKEENLDSDAGGDSEGTVTLDEAYNKEENLFVDAGGDTKGAAAVDDDEAYNKERIQREAEDRKEEERVKAMVAATIPPVDLEAQRRDIQEREERIQQGVQALREKLKREERRQREAEDRKEEERVKAMVAATIPPVVDPEAQRRDILEREQQSSQTVPRVGQALSPPSKWHTTTKTESFLP